MADNIIGALRKAFSGERQMSVAEKANAAELAEAERRKKEEEAKAAAKAKAAAELEAARRKAKATGMVTPDNPAGIDFKRGGAVKGWGKASKGKKARYF